MIARAERKQQTRAELLRAARAVIGAKGFRAATARDVAAEAGVAVGTVFLHFPTMAGLAETLLDETVGQALDAARRTMPTSGVIDQLVHVSVTLCEAYDADPELSRQVVSGSLFEATPDGPSGRRMEQFRAWVAERVGDAVAAGQIAPIGGDEAFLGFFALYFGVVVAGLRGDLDAASRPVLLRSLLNRLLQSTGGR